MGKGARNRKARKEGTNRRNTLVTKETNPLKMNNPGNIHKALRLDKKESPAGKQD